MTRCRRESNPDLICTSYKTVSNRSTRLLLLEIVAESWLDGHKKLYAELGLDIECQCSVCEKAREAMRLKHERR